jgi:hypothetical protein
MGFVSDSALTSINHRIDNRFTSINHMINRFILLIITFPFVHIVIAVIML